MKLEFYPFFENRDQAQKIIIFWLLNREKKEKEELINKVNLDWLDDKYRALFELYTDIYFKKDKTKFKNRIAWELLRTCDIESMGWIPFMPDQVIDFLKAEKANELLTDTMREAILKKHDFKTTMRALAGAIDKSSILTEANQDYKIKSILDKALLERENKDLRIIPTGIKKLDEYTQPLRQGHLWIIGGYTNVGKTGLMIIILSHLISLKRRAAIYSLEMTDVDLVLKLNSYLEFIENQNPIDTIAYSNLEIINDKNSLEDIERDIKFRKPEVAFIDFIQNIETDDKDEYSRLTNVSRRLQWLAQSQNLCIVALSQLSNESVKYRNKKLIGFKGSGAIAAACNVGIELERHKGDKRYDLMEMRIVKNRHGQTGTFRYAFDRHTGFIDFAKEPPQTSSILRNEDDKDLDSLF